jgi:hypothetical protein
MAHVQGSDCFCWRIDNGLWYLLSDESWRIELTQKAMEMDFCVVFCGNEDSYLAILHLSRVELHCKLQEKLHCVTWPLPIYDIYKQWKYTENRSSLWSIVWTMWSQVTFIGALHLLHCLAFLFGSGRLPVDFQMLFVLQLKIIHQIIILLENTCMQKPSPCWQNHCNFRTWSI